jgi:hypothetical protein
MANESSENGENINSAHGVESVVMAIMKKSVMVVKARKSNRQSIAKRKWRK